MKINNKETIIKPTIVITAAGPPRPQLLTISSDIKSAAMVPINGKPILGWMLDDLIKQGFESFVILISEEDSQAQKYVDRRYMPANIDIRTKGVEQTNNPRGIAHSLYKGLELNILSEDILIILGHTLFCENNRIFENNLLFEDDWAGYSKVHVEEKRWCYVEMDENLYIKKYIDKPNSRSLPDNALIGVYYIKDKVRFFSCLKSVVENKIKIGGFNQISSALKEYGDVKGHEFDENKWLDCGSITGIHRSKRMLISSRSFNTITVDEDIGILTKKCKNSSAFHQEFSWYVSLPNELIGLVPRVIDFKPCSSERKEAELSLEYYGYNTLEETWIYHNVSLDVWISIFKHLFSILKKFRSFTADLSKEDYNSIYLVKTKDRIEKLREQQSDINWRILFSYSRLFINGTQLQGFSQLEPSIYQRIENLYNPEHSTVIHGDFHFANILYDINSRLIKLIDPRGNFGSSGIYGDCKYDFAKLRHSINGDYNYIVNDLFCVSRNENNFDLKIENNNIKTDLLKWFDNKVSSEEFSIEDIKFIEGLLFISMLPLHSDNKSRQLAIFARSMELLNEVLNPNHCNKETYRSKQSLTDIDCSVTFRPESNFNNSIKQHNEVFICYSHEDTNWKVRFIRHLSNLKGWDDTKIKPGSEWRKDIKDALHRAKVAVLLISADFLRSDFINSVELPIILERKKKEELEIFPIIIQPCRWKSNPELSSLQAITHNREPLSKAEQFNIEDIFSETAEKISNCLR